VTARTKTETGTDTDPPDDEAGLAPDAPDRSWPARAWYELCRWVTLTYFSASGGFRASGAHHLPRSGPALLVSNHLSYLDVFALGTASPRRLNYVARSTLFLPGFGALIRSVGGFPIQREGMGASGLKETLRRLRRGGVVLLFPEGTRSPDGRLGAMKPGIAVLARKARVPVVPAAVAGTFEAWPRGRALPGPHAVRVDIGPPIPPEEIAGLSAEAVTALIHDRIADCQRLALRALARDLQVEPVPDPPRHGGKRPLGGFSPFD
jgi:1-acyl-sn-glycerol-3-phosphate acyltransferase